jgi:cardiolipin synthase (CMP-forming)
VPINTVNIPNILTLARLCLVPVVIVMITSHAWLGAFAVFVIAGITDAVDGFIARHFNQRTELGAYLDPLADKALLVSIYITLAIVNIIPSWLAIIVVARDIMILGAILLALVLHNPITIEPLKISKANTFVQIAFAAFMLGTLAFNITSEMPQTAMVIIVALLTIGSMGAYLSLWLKHMTKAS